MTCKGCEGRKKKIRDWLGITRGINYRHAWMIKHIRSELLKRDKKIAKLEVLFRKLSAK